MQLGGYRSPSDRSLAGLLLAFFLALYLLAGSGHGYSPDGDFAFRMGRSFLIDPSHEYFNSMKSGLNSWGPVVPVLAQPLLLMTDPIAKAMPQKDRVTVDNRSFTLGIFRTPGLPEAAPTAGLLGGAPEEYVRASLTGTPATSLAVISFLSLSDSIPQGTTVAEITLTDSAGNHLAFPLRAGIETAEWSLGRESAGVQHQEARVASIWSGNTAGRNYYAELPFGRTFAPTELRIRHIQGQGNLYVRALALLNPQTNGLQAIPPDFRLWSERENEDLWARLFYSSYNAIVTALACVLLFALARLLGYSQRVSVVATLLYGLATQAWPYAKLDFSEPTLVLLVLATLYLIMRWGRDRRGLLLVLAGITAILAAATKYASTVLVSFMVLQIVLLHWEKHPSLRDLPKLLKPLLLFCAPFLAAAVPALWYFSRSFGYFPIILEVWDGVQRGWLPLPLWIGLQGLLFSPGKSFFLYSPPVLLALVSVIPFVRRHRGRSAALLAIAMVYFTIYSKKVAWHAGAGWGPRYQVLVIPLLILMAAPLIQKAVDERNRWARFALVATFVLGVSVQMLGVSKNFDAYLGMFRYQIVQQLPDQGAQYGGSDYYPYSEGLDDHNSITATMLAWPFSPILAHGWLLSVDVLSLGPSSLQPFRDRVLSTPPWKLWGIGAMPEHPEYGLGLDFWSMRLWTDFPSYPHLLLGVLLVLLLLEAALIVSGARLLAMLLKFSVHLRGAMIAWFATSAGVLLLFDGIHFLL